MKIRAGEQEYCLSHLQQLSRRIAVPLRGIATPKEVLVEFRFSNHCYSRGPGTGESIPPDMLIPDGSPKHPRNRIFDPRRHRLSLNLPVLIDQAIAGTSHLYRSRKHNYFSVSGVSEDIDGATSVCEYYVFMSAKKECPPQQQKRISVFIESAYPETPSIKKPERVAPRNFCDLMGEIWSRG